MDFPMASFLVKAVLMNHVLNENAGEGFVVFWSRRESEKIDRASG
ncbi:MAG: hypothetical protein V8R80_01465 [Eubacterium sp.]